MPKPILPDLLREQIADLISSGASTIDIYDRIIDEAEIEPGSEELVMKTISSIRSKVTFKNQNIKPYPEKNYITPSIKKFDIKSHINTITQLNTVIMEKKFENLCEPVVVDILQNYEGFRNIESAGSMQGFYNPPFDYLAFKGKTPYLIEFKGALNSFNTPGETDKRHIKELMSHIDGLKMAIIQLRINTGEYRIFCNNEMNLFFDGRKVSIAPVVEWIDSRLNKSD